MLKTYIKRLAAGESLSAMDSYLATRLMFTHSSDVQIATFLTLLSTKMLTSDEIFGVVKYAREMMKSIKFDFPVLDIVGTGGDNAGTVNISTASALLAAACGIPVVKHGNKAASSKCGSADVLEALGYRIEQSIDDLRIDVTERNFGFCFAPQYHPMLARVRNIRSELGIPTIFNLIGPLVNPANADHVMLGVYKDELVPLIADVLYKLGTRQSIVFHAHGLDELSTLGTIDALLVNNNGIEKFIIDPQAFGLKPATLADLKGDDAHYNAQVIRQTLSGTPTSLTDTLILNAAVALFLYGKVSEIGQGIDLARTRLASGKILKPNYLYDVVFADKQHELRESGIIGRIPKSLKTAILAKSGRAVIAEIKRASPSHGKLVDITDPSIRAMEYVGAGAAAISVLTDAHFSGKIEDLTQVANRLKDTNAAILCKDFIFCPQQIARAYAAGADAILLIVALLHHQTKDLVNVAHAFGLEALVEVHHPSELDIALNSGGDIIGVNQRDLSDLSMHRELFAALAPQIPSDMVKIAESGISSFDDAQEVYKLGYDGILVGSAFSKLGRAQEFFQ